MYHNTTSIQGDKLTQAQKKSDKQEEIILRYFQQYPDYGFTPFDVWKIFPNYPITSIRRAISNLSFLGILQKTGRMRMGGYGAPNNVWRLANNQLEMFR